MGRTPVPVAPTGPRPTPKKKIPKPTGTTPDDPAAVHPAAVHAVVNQDRLDDQVLEVGQPELRVLVAEAC